jgi:glycosyl transferase family 1
LRSEKLGVILVQRPTVLIVGPSRVGDMAWFVRLACDRLGWRTKVLDNRAYIRRRIPGRTGAAIDWVERSRQRSRRREGLQRRLIEAARGVDIVLTVKGQHLVPETVERLSLHTKTVNWYPDTPVFEQIFDQVGVYTLFCPKDDWTTERLQAMGFSNVVTLPHATDPRVLTGTDAFGGVDVSVLGSIYPYRLFWIRRIASEGLSVEVWGGKVHGVAGVRSQAQQAVGADQGRAFRTGTLTLNTHSPLDVAGGNQRLFDAAAAMVPQITENLTDTVRHLGDAVATFDSAEEFDAQLKKLIADRGYRDTLVRSGHAIVTAKHTYEHRLSRLEELL